MSRDRFLDYFESKEHRGVIPACTATVRHRHPACGDEIDLTVLIESDILRSVRFNARGCVVSQAAAAMLCEHVEGQAIADINTFTARDMLSLIGIPLSPRRIGCALLAYEALRMFEPFTLSVPPSPAIDSAT